MRKSAKFVPLKRVDLLERVSDAEDTPIMLVVAPMGYGKSSVVREYLDETDKRYIWCTIGPSPVSEEWVWNRVIGEIENVNTALYQKLIQFGDAYAEGADVALFLTTLKNELQQREFFLVLDDYQMCNGRNLNRFLTKLAYEDIPELHVIIISRNYIDLPYEEMQIKGYCTVIDQRDFSLTQRETAELMEKNGVKLTREEQEQVCQYTDGWIAAVALLLSDYRRNGRVQFTGTVNRLLKEVIYDKFPKEDRVFLFRMSLFPELSVEALAWITGQTVTVGRMNNFMASTGLIHQNSINGKYMMHSLLCNTVYEDETVREETGGIYERFADFLCIRGDFVEAILYYEKAGNRDAVFTILDGEDRFTLMEQMQEFIYTLIEEDKCLCHMEQHPIAVLSVIFYLMMSGDLLVSQKGKRLFEFVREHYGRESETSHRQRNLRGELAVVESLLTFNDLEATNRCLQRAWELREHKPSHVFYRMVYTYGVPETLLMYHSRPGTLKKVVEEEHKYSENYMLLFHNIQGSFEELVNAEYFLETGNVEEALRNAEAALERARFRRQVCMVLSSFFVILRCHIFCGNKKEFDHTMQGCSDYMKDNVRKMLVFDYDQIVGYVYALTGQLNKVPLWLRHRELDGCNQIVRDCRNGCIIYGLYLCRKKRWELLSVNAEEMEIPYFNTKHVFAEIFARIFQSIAFWHKDHRENALRVLQDAVNMAEPDGIVMPFAETAFEVLPALRELEQRSPFTEQLISYGEKWMSGAQAFSELHFSEAKFTKREGEIMELLVAGYRNSEIAGRMNLAQVTVEKNLTNIYRKIGVSNRTSAIRWYNNNK